MSDSETAAKRDGGCFVPGQSCNPAGRPNGAQGRATLLAEALRAGADEKMAPNMIELATFGNKLALAFCVGRPVPRLRGAASRPDLPEAAERGHAAIPATTARALHRGSRENRRQGGMRRTIARVPPRAGLPVKCLF